MSNSHKKVIKQDFHTIHQLLYVWCASAETQELAMLIRQNFSTNEDQKRIWDLMRIKRLEDLGKMRMIHEQMQDQLQLHQQLVQEQNHQLILLQQKVKDYWLKQQHLMLLLLLLLQLFLCCWFFYSRN